MGSVQFGEATGVKEGSLPTHCFYVCTAAIRLLPRFLWELFSEHEDALGSQKTNRQPYGKACKAITAVVPAVSTRQPQLSQYF